MSLTKEQLSGWHDPFTGAVAIINPNVDTVSLAAIDMAMQLLREAIRRAELKGEDCIEVGPAARYL